MTLSVCLWLLSIASLLCAGVMIYERRGRYAFECGLIGFVLLAGNFLGWNWSSHTWIEILRYVAVSVISSAFIGVIGYRLRQPYELWDKDG